MKWKTQDGREMEVFDMKTSHIQNALAMLKRKGFISASTLHFYLTCARPHGDMAQDCFDIEFEEIIDSPVSPFIDGFEKELEKRT